jgi:hypothetical protein
VHPTIGPQMDRQAPSKFSKTSKLLIKCRRSDGIENFTRLPDPRDQPHSANSEGVACGTKAYHRAGGALSHQAGSVRSSDDFTLEIA